MRNLFTTIMLISIGIFHATSQENSVKINPFALLGGVDLVSYERGLSDNSSGVISGAISNYDIGGSDYKAFGLGLQYRYYFREALKGWYAAAHGLFQSGDVVEELLGFKVESDFTAFGIGLRGGYQWVWQSGLTLDLNTGFTYRSYSYDDSTSALFESDGVYLALGVGIGYSF